MAEDFDIKIDKKEFETFMNDLKHKFGKQAQIDLLDEFALLGHRQIVKLTPKDRGTTRRAWKIESGSDYRKIINTSPVMLFLEEGTKDHGPVSADFLCFKPRKGKFKGMFLRKKRVRGIKARYYIDMYIPIFIKQVVEKINKIIGLL